MSLLKVLKYITNHPLNRNQKINSLWKFARWQLGIRLLKYPIIYTFTENSKLIIAKGMTGATQNLYCGLHEFYDMGFLLHFLRPDDVFYDIGANIGSYTILASSDIGVETVSFEPIPTTCEKLKKNVYLNQVNHLVDIRNIGLGSQKSSLHFTKDLDTINHVAAQETSDTIEVPVDIFDNLFDIDKAALIKIDTEGFETEVLNGMSIALKNKYLKAIIIELNGMSNRYGFNDDSIHNKLLNHNFKPFLYDPFTRQLSKREGYGTANTIYVKDYDFVASRVASAKSVTINNNTF